MVEVLPDDAPAPRLCHLIKWPDFDGYGFNLHAERSNPGQFIGKIDEDSPAQMAGLREGDRIIEVNGVNISNENHRQVVERIKSNPMEAKLLVVDLQADLWYREQDLTVKSTQMNVIYMKTPVPRPRPDSPRAKKSQVDDEHGHHHEKQHSASANFHNNNDHQANQHQKYQNSSLSPSSLEVEASASTSDFNDDSIEQQQQQQQHQQQVTTSNERDNQRAELSVTPAPMSPDSGRGDEEAPVFVSRGLMKSPEPEEVLVEAEINQQTLPISELSKMRKQLVMDEVKQKVTKRQQEEEEELKVQDDSATSKQHTFQPDSLTEEVSTPEQKEQERQKHSGSADSGKPTDSTSGSNADSTNASIADSLDDDQAAARTKDQTKTTTTNLITKEEVVQSVISKLNDNNNCETINNSEPTTTSATIISGQTKTNVSQPLALESVSVSGKKNYEEQKSENHTNNNNIEVPQEKTKIVEKNKMTATSVTPASAGEATKPVAKANTPLVRADNDNNNQMTTTTSPHQNNNNYSGLNLNMTASQMREIIASRKKFDPKKAQMNIRQKYEIIQQM